MKNLIFTIVFVTLVWLAWNFTHTQKAILESNNQMQQPNTEQMEQNTEEDMQPYQNGDKVQAILVTDFGETELTLELALDNAARAQGLMHRTELAEGSGMLFVFPDVQYRSFWMRNTLIPLDIVFLDENLNVINIRSNAKPGQESPSFDSTSPSMYVLELPAGSGLELGIAAGNSLEIEQIPEAIN